jgi:hypothetical protein
MAAIMTATDFNCFPTHNPCAQCGKLITRPIWSERGDHRISFVWSCDACDYQFTTIAIFDDHPQRDHQAAA